MRALAFDARGNQVAQARRSTPERRDRAGSVEYDPDAMFAAVVECLGEVAGALGGRPVAGIAVASIGESCVLVDEAGRSLAPSIVWHDTRTEGEAQTLRETVGVERVFEITGLQLDHIFTLGKLMWMRTHWPEAMRRTRKVLMIADWIAFRLSGVAATDFTLASRTLYLDLRRRRWSDELLGLAGFDSLGAGAADGQRHRARARFSPTCLPPPALPASRWSASAPTITSAAAWPPACPAGNDDRQHRHRRSPAAGHGAAVVRPDGAAG